MLQYRIDTITQQSFEQRAKYKLKSTETLNRNVGMYTEEQLSFIKTELRDFLLYFGYVSNEQDPGHNTPFFTYDDITDDELKVKYCGFKHHNASVLANLGQNEKGGEHPCFHFKSDTKLDMATAAVNVRDRITPNVKFD